MLAPSGGGLILYQAYGNLYAMTGRKSHLLEEKQIPSIGVFDEVSFYTLFRGLRSPKPINMVIEMADRSMQSPKGIVENVLVKINKFIFPVDFVILDIVEDNKVPIIMRRPMLDTAHARIDVFRKKISLEVIDEYGGPEYLEELLMNDDINGDLGNLLEDNNLLPDFDNQYVISLSSPGMDDIWDDLDQGVLTTKMVDAPVRPEFLMVSKVDRPEWIYLVCPMLPAIPNPPNHLEGDKGGNLVSSYTTDKVPNLP
ncbi:putative reverse transcriptase domain-containing protein [Tanacetum coccineum]